MEEIDQKLERRRDGIYICTVCRYETLDKARARFHVEAKHVETAGYLCPYCQKHCPTLNALKCHKRRCNK